MQRWYANLETLKKRGFISYDHDRKDIDRKGRPRTYFKLEGLGMQALAEFQASWSRDLHLAEERL